MLLTDALAHLASRTLTRSTFSSIRLYTQPTSVSLTRKKPPKPPRPRFQRSTPEEIEQYRKDNTKAQIMNWQAHVLSSASSDTEPTIVIMFESAKYVFNVGENTTRAIAQSGRTWRKIRSAFLSRVCTETCSGLPGAPIHCYLSVIFCSRDMTRLPHDPCG